MLYRLPNTLFKRRHSKTFDGEKTEARKPGFYQSFRAFYMTYISWQSHMESLFLRLSQSRHDREQDVPQHDDSQRLDA